MKIFNKNKAAENTKTFAVCGIVEIDDKILLVRHTYGTAKNRILLPGGYVKQGEIPTTAVEREIFEGSFSESAIVKVVIFLTFKNAFLSIISIV